MRKVLLVAALTVAVSSMGFSVQSQDRVQAEPTNVVQTVNGRVPVFRIEVVGYRVKAVNYHNRKTTEIGFEGTSLLAGAKGRATIENKLGAAHIHVRFKKLEPAVRKFGPPYLTYVLWAITPNGRTENLGEVLTDPEGNADLNVTTNLQTFGLFVTAEPYFGVTRPSDMVVAENDVLPNTTGTIEQVEAKAELLKRGQYTENVPSDQVTPLVTTGQAPLDVYEAENAIRIAKWAGADQNAPDTLGKAELNLQNAQDTIASRHGDKKTVINEAREAVQTAEDARLIALNKEAAQHRAELRADAEAAQAQASQAQQQAARAQEQAQEAAESKARARAEQERAEARAQQANVTAQEANAAAQDANQRAEEAEQRAEQVRERLLRQLNSILQTKDTPNGLLVRMSDVLFAPGRYQLTENAKLALAKMSGVLLSYPGLKLTVNGYTDSTGSDEVNQTLSDKRSEAVRTFLVEQGVPSSDITAQGFADANPIASNDTAQGRKLNRRVDMIVSGSAIGTNVATASTAGQ
jgi:outer membrane protein OmpA-like peptidoglycan-associated protein